MNRHEQFVMVYFDIGDESRYPDAALGMTQGMPAGAKWFCWEHAAAAQERSHLPPRQAVAEIRALYNLDAER